MSLDLKTVAADVLAELGTLITIQTITRTDDVVAGTSAETLAEQEVRAAIDGFRTELIDGITVKVGDKRATISAKNLDAVPATANTRVVSFGITYAVLNVEPIPDGDEIAAYTLHLRSA